MRIMCAFRGARMEALPFVVRKEAASGLHTSSTTGEPSKHASDIPLIMADHNYISTHSQPAFCRLAHMVQEHLKNSHKMYYSTRFEFRRIRTQSAAGTEVQS